MLCVYFSNGMATGMIEFVMKRGRAYHCTPYGYIENKSRAELHFYNHHVPDYQIPYACVPCEFKKGIRRKLDRHLEYANHRENVDLQVESVSTLISQTPHYIVMEQDLVKLSKEDSAGHWMGVFQVLETQVGDTSGEEEDIRSQLLRTTNAANANSKGDCGECCEP